MHPDSVDVEGEETTGLMRELEKHGREGKDLVGGGINIFVRGREELVILCKRERERVGEESVSHRHITLLPNDPAFSSAVWSPSSICSMPSLKTL